LLLSFVFAVAFVFLVVIPEGDLLSSFAFAVASQLLFLASSF